MYRELMIELFGIPGIGIYLVALLGLMVVLVVWVLLS